MLHPLLTRTQLRNNTYKRPQIVQTLESLLSNGNIRDISPTTRRLVERCLGSDWCIEFRKISKTIERVSSPGGDSVQSTTRTEMVATATHVHRSDSVKAKAKTLKPSKSVENMKSPAKPGAKAAPPPIADLKQRTKKDSAFSLASVAAAVPSLPSPSASTQKRPGTNQGLSASTPDLVDSKSGSRLATRTQLGQIVTTNAQGHHSAPSSAVNTPTMQPPPSPPRRRKPPAVPVRKEGHSGIIGLPASSSSSSTSSSTQSPLSRYPVQLSQ